MRLTLHVENFHTVTGWWDLEDVRSIYMGHVATTDGSVRTALVLDDADGTQRHIFIDESKQMYADLEYRNNAYNELLYAFISAMDKRGTEEYMQYLTSSPQICLPDSQPDSSPADCSEIESQYAG